MRFQRRKITANDYNFPLLWSKKEREKRFSRLSNFQSCDAAECW